MVADMGKTDIPPSADDELLDRIRQSVMRHLADSDYSVVQLADDVGASRGTINRKMRELLGVTPAAYIRSIRLKQAAYILISGNINVNEVADRVGFSTHSNFSHNFHQFFGMTPTEFVTRYADADPDSEPPAQTIGMTTQHPHASREVRPERTRPYIITYSYRQPPQYRS